MSNTQDKKALNISLLVIFAGTIIMFLAFSFSFYMTIRGREKTKVPNLVGEELIDGLISLQNRSLYPKVMTRFSSEPTDKGKIIAQDPPAGSLVKAGKNITLTISRGSIVDTVGDYRNQNLEDVKLELQTLFTTYKPLLKIKDPVIYVFDDEEAGTILEQKPLSGTEISGLTEVTLIVSRGPVSQNFIVKKYTGLDFKTAVSTLSRNNIPFQITLAEESGAEAGTIISQSPDEGVSVEGGTEFHLKMTKPENLDDDEVFGVFDYDLREYSVYVNLKIEVLEPDGDRKALVSMKHRGGHISLPYVEKSGSQIILSVYGNEVIRITLD